jgi:RNA polymerase sigma factor (sigma-70 family)
MTRSNARHSGAAGSVAAVDALRRCHGVKETRASNDIDRGRSRARALMDTALIGAMRDGTPEAWAEFDARFRPLLERYAARVGIPRWEWSACITEVLDDEALRLVERPTEIPRHLTAYLVRAVRNRYLTLERAAARRVRQYSNAARAESSSEGVLGLVMSEHARRSSDPLRVSEDRASASNAVTRFARALDAHLSPSERLMLAWVAEGVPQRVIAEWLGVSREAAKKRIARLCRRLRTLAGAACEQLPPSERGEIGRLLRRASAPRRTSHSGESDDG